MIRSTVGREIGVRVTPTVEFFSDAIPETAAHMEKLLAETAAQDAAIAAAAAGAKFAGEENPYKPAREQRNDFDAG
ncbi:unannotated protein [freshwater metagenome]|uniref:Unannotated protein n=1 Tax=freshwater metagenome TaxID=449393 RepID=A0A6J7SBF2_9ZZZZ|nr:hypothetical protein [Actinomycetota bacterium]